MNAPGCWLSTAGYALGAESNVILQSNALVDSYDSCSGPYDPDDCGCTGNIRAGGNVILGGNNVTGTVEENQPPGETPVAPFSATGDLHVHGTVELTSGDYVYNNLTVYGEGILRGLGEVRIWVTGTLTIQGNGRVEASDRIPANLILYGTWENRPFVFQSNSTTTAMVHAPASQIVLQSNCDLYGKVQGYTIELQSNARVHFDVATETGCN